MPTLLAQVIRSDIVESEHYGHVAVAYADGASVASAGRPDYTCYLRSSAKPLQALAVAESGALEAFGLSDRHLAVMCGSHAGLDQHTRVVAEVLSAAGLTPQDLACGPEGSQEDAEHGLLRNNCSGKHAGMLAACLRLGLELPSYLHPDHPHQRRVRAIVAAFTGVAEDQVAIGVDGCGAPTFAVPLAAMARAFARLAAPDGIEAPLAAAAARVRRAMAEHPEMVSGPGHFNTELLRHWGTAIVAKGGAEGLFCIGVAERGLGLALKIADGSPRAIAPALLSALDELGLLPAPVREAVARFGEPEVRNCQGRVVGSIRGVRLGLPVLAGGGERT